MKIALLEDDLAFAETVQEWLEEAGYEVDTFKTGLDFLRKYSHALYDLCIFDWTLPDMEGPDVMVSIKLKSSHLPPIVFLTGRGDEADIVRVLESGADDYIVKPTTKAIFIARIRALLRRTYVQNNEAVVYEFGQIKVDAQQRVATLNQEEIKLTDKEFDLVLYFLKNEGMLLSRTHLMNVIWGASSELETRKIDVHVSHLRTKLKLTPEYGWKLTSIYQQGYRLERCPA